MARLRVLSGRQICRILEQLVVMQRRTAQTTITVPVPDHAEVAIGTLLSIIRQSGVGDAVPKDLVG
jgi:predicted RNA binding protein YcfA (HicA-like mRNA interferase family)